MRQTHQKGLSAPTLLACVVGLFLVSESAHAFRCGSRIIMDGMHESEVIRLCGEPVSVAHVGYAIRSYHYGGSLSRRHDRYPEGYGYYREEVIVTEMVFNFGPRKLMRKLRFEGGILTSIRTMGYGYIHKDDP